ncbi:capsule biosynthesis protein [Stappia sp.]|jgi:capsular polysaccharide export protein|uniref:capsule biosynthesis protein n=1 Tax=Stappia sp. TaxID=1870903 RepID=UPI003A99FD7F
MQPQIEVRTVLFLQGPPSDFPRVVADALAARGHRTLRINFSLSDWVLWHDTRCSSFRGRLADWPEFLETFLREHGVTHIVCYQDRFPYHSAALEVARRLGVAVIAYENGYLRPDWITAELDGMSVRSRFPSDPAQIHAAAASLAPVDIKLRYPHPFWLEAVHEVVFHVVNALDFLVFRNFDQDKFYHPIFEYLSMIPRLVLGKRRDRLANVLIEDLIESGAPYFVFPLQLQSDYQLRYNAPFGHLSEALDKVIASFAAHAHEAARLVVKIHPMDQGIEPWRRIVRNLARRHGVKRRVHVVDGGHLVTLLQHTAGALMVNSTTGLHAVRLRCPVKVLGIAVYDMPGLTCQLSLDRFWRTPQVPEVETCDAVQRLMAHSIQVQGNFYTREGKTAAAVELARRIEEGTINLPGANEVPAPRIERARSLGIPVDFEGEMAARGRTGLWRRAWRG